MAKIKVPIQLKKSVAKDEFYTASLILSRLSNDLKEGAHMATVLSI